MEARNGVLTERTHDWRTRFPPSTFRDIRVEGRRVEALVLPDYLLTLCSGHFPGDPLVPGATLIALVADLVVGAFEIEFRRLRSIRLRGIAFLRPVRPDSPLILASHWDHDGAHIVARIHASVAGKLALRGSVIFEGSEP